MHPTRPTHPTQKVICNGLVWIQVHPNAQFDMLGYIPTFLSANDERSAAQQIDAAYGHGGGWKPFRGFTLLPNGDLKYPGDPPTRLLWETNFLHVYDNTSELISFYEHAWVRITQPDGSWEVSRID